MYIRHLRIRQLRCFADANLSLRYPTEIRRETDDPSYPNVNLLLGDNGAGKTTILKAIALAVLAPVIGGSGFRSFYLVRRNTNTRRALIESNVILHGQDVRPSSKSWKSLRRPRVRFNASIYRREDYETVLFSERSFGRETLYRDRSPAFFLSAYGTSRRVEDSIGRNNSEDRKSRTQRYARVAGLFEAQASLVPLFTWLPEIKAKNKRRYHEICQLFAKFLPEQAKFTGKTDNKDFFFKVGSQSVPFEAMSDGYRGYIGWVCDLLYQLTTICPARIKLVEVRGIVLVDEIDLHLHPHWQRTVIERVSRALPNMQFIFTTHSPIVAASIAKENIFLMDVDEGGASTVRQSHERIFGLSADQALESRYFGLQSTRAKAFLEEIQELTKKSTSKNPDAAIHLMDRISGVDSKEEVKSNRKLVERRGND